MLKQSVLTAITMISSLAINAQNYEDKNYDWEKTRKPFTVTPKDEEHPAVILKRYVKIEFTYDEKAGGSPFIYKTLHVIIRVNNTEGIDQYNKIYVPMDEVENLEKVKARTITKAGKVTELDKDDIIDVQEGEETISHKAFVLEGLEPGSEIEYFYITKNPFTISDREYFQSDIPWKNVHFELITPENLIYETKSYNKLPEADTTVKNEKNYAIIDIPEVEDLEDEPYSLYGSSRMRLEYYLAYNKARDFSRLYTLSSAAETMYELIVTKIESAEKKSVDDLLKQLKLSSVTNKEQKIKQFENYVKTNIRVFDNVSILDLTQVLKNKYTSELGITRLYAAALKAMGINFQIVITSDRSRVKFDPELNGWATLDDYLIYFPEFDKYLAPKEEELRYGMVSFYNTNNYGLYIKPLKLGDTEKGLGKVNFIPALPGDVSYDDLDIQINFTADDRQQIKVVRKMAGCSALSIQPFYSLLTKEKQKELNEELVKSLVPDAEFVSVEVKNGEQNKNPLEEPFMLTATVNSSALLESAGNKVLFKIGEVIGRQSEMYQEKERKLDVELDYNHGYTRVIKFTIPANYTVKNLDDLKINVSHMVDGKKVYYFESSYTVSGSEVSVTVKEYYLQINCPKSEFQQFRSVINAAADFNKIVLVMEKKN